MNAALWGAWLRSGVIGVCLFLGILGGSWRLTDLISEFMREFHRFTCRRRLLKFILDFDREHRLAVSPSLADHGFPSVFSPLGSDPDRS